MDELMYSVEILIRFLDFNQPLKQSIWANIARLTKQYKFFRMTLSTEWAHNQINLVLQDSCSVFENHFYPDRYPKKLYDESLTEFCDALHELLKEYSVDIAVCHSDFSNK